jgi:hypothetical protein
LARSRCLTQFVPLGEGDPESLLRKPGVAFGARGPLLAEKAHRDRAAGGVVGRGLGLRLEVRTRAPASMAHG